MSRIDWPRSKYILQPAVVRRVAPGLDRQHLAAIPVLPEGLHRWIEALPFRSQAVVVDTGVNLADHLSQIGRMTAIREIERGLAFPSGQLTSFGQVVDVMKFTIRQHGLAARSLTARLVAEEGRVELLFSIYRHTVSLFDYVQVAVSLPGLKLLPHPNAKEIFFLTAV